MSNENLPADHPAHPSNVAPVTPVVPVVPVVAPVVEVAPVVPPVVDAPVGTYTGETALELAINVLASQTGITNETFDRALAGALQHNDINLINVEALTAGLKPDQAAQAKALAQAVFKETQATVQRTTQEAYTLAGGEAQWKEATAVFNTQAPEHIRAVVRTLLDTGDVKNAAQFVLDTVRGNGMVNSGTPPIAGGTGSVTQGTSLAEFNAQLAELERTAGNRSLEQGTHAVKFQQIVAARNLGRKQGR